MTGDPDPRPLRSLQRFVSLFSSRLLLCVLLLACSLPPAVIAQDAATLPTTGQPPAVDYEVEIDAPEGIRLFLLENLTLQKWRGNERVDAEQLKRLVDAARGEIATLLGSEGYYAPRIDSTLDQVGNKWKARFAIVPNELARVGSVQLDFTGAITGAATDLRPSIETLRAEWALNKGDIFRQSNWEAAKRNLVQEMSLVRYPLAELADSRAEVDVKTGLVALTLTVNSGPAVVFGELVISGLARFPASTISNLNPIRAGRAYRQAQLIEFQRRLQDTGYFQRVEVSAELEVAATVAPANADPAQPDTALVAPVRVTVEEQKLQRVELGAGYSTNTGSRGQVSYERLNLFGTAVRLKSALLLETRKQSGQLSLAFPTTAAGERDSLSTWYKREDVQNETTRTSSIAATRAWGRPANETSVTVLYSRERKDVTADTGIETTFNQSLSANLGHTWRRTDNLLSPTRGYLLNLQAGGAPLTFLTSARFGRLYGKATGYFPLGENQTVILRAEAGAVIAAGRERIPADFLFRAGGDQSVRGYGYQQLGVTDGSAIVGGRYLAIAGAEIIHWLAPRYPNWGVAAFVDAGNAADRPADLKPVYGYGVGARWKSPVGVVNLDIAYGQQVRQARLHFSLGVSF